MARHGELATFPEIALDGSELYWTVPEVTSGVWRGRLMHRNLEQQGAESLDLGEGAVLSGPSAGNGIVAYEMARQQGSPAYSVRYRQNGLTVDIAGLASEPSVGQGYLLVKRADRFSGGTISALPSAGADDFDFGNGEAPYADASLAVWSAGGALGAWVARPLDRCVTQFLGSRMVNNTTEGSPTIGGSRLAWVYVVQSGASVSEFIRTAVIERLAC
jgi:hypothetical protein